MDTTHARVAAGKRLLDEKDFRSETGLGKTMFYSLIKSGELRSIKIGPKTRRVPREWFEEWLQRLKADATSDA
jgi:excisionase family DNA binding protein